MGSSSDKECLYSILGLNTSCSLGEIRAAYRKLAMKWHPDKCLMEASDARDEAKLKFQAIQEAYSVLSDDKKRLLYDGNENQNNSQEYGMKDFLGELASMMTPNSESSLADQFDEFQMLFMSVVDGSMGGIEMKSSFYRGNSGGSEADNRKKSCSPSSTSSGRSQAHHVPPGNFTTQAFCMGVAARTTSDERSTRKSCARSRKKRCSEKDNFVAPTTSWCEFCNGRPGQAIGRCFCGSSTVNSPPFLQAVFGSQLNDRN